METIEAHKKKGTELWIFGYGSLIWRPNFTFVEKKAGVVRGFKRRFWQGSPDHRGVPASLGRVVTCVATEVDADKDPHQSSASSVWGMCYKVAESEKEEVLSYLDVREAGGYTLIDVNVFADETDTTPIIKNALLYSATADNEFYLGPSNGDEMAIQIAKSVGPSGENREYLLELADALIALKMHDEHVQWLADLVRQHIREGVEPDRRALIAYQHMQDAHE